MYKIYADDTLVYDSTLDELKISKGSITLETNKSGSFTFSVYPDHFFYDNFIKLKTVITVYKDNKIVFRGRILNDITDYWNNKTLTCEGELGFLQDSIIRPFEFTGTPRELFIKLINEHNAQVDNFKKFNIGRITVEDPNDYVNRSNAEYDTALNNISSRLITESLGGYLYITHGEDGTDLTPTIHYLSDFETVSDQVIEFGENLKDYTKTVKAEEIATAIIPLGHASEEEGSNGKKLTIADVNDGKDYVYSEVGVALYGWIFKVVNWDDVTIASNLKRKAEAYLDNIIKQTVTIELNAVDLHLLDKSIDSFKINDYIRVVSEPHNLAETYLCQKQTIDLLNPENDTITLGATYLTLTDGNATLLKSVANVTSLVNRQADSIEGALNGIEDLNYKTSEYKLAEQRLTSLMAQSFGVFKTEEILEDGSTIAYMHNKKKLEDSTTIWKMTADAFAVSTDGGITWNAGLDSSGNAVLNILSTIGINATWINADNLNAISSKIGGWDIDSNAIYKDVQDPNNSSIVYRVYLQPPALSNPTGTVVLSCQKSTDGGKTFTRLFSLFGDGRMHFEETQLQGDGIRIGDGFYADKHGTATIGKVSVMTNGTTSWKNEEGITVAELEIQTDGTTFFKADAMRVDDISSTNSATLNGVEIQTLADGSTPFTGDVSIGDKTITVYRGCITDIS